LVTLRFCAPLGGLGTTYDVHLGLIGKRVVYFLLVLIELFSLGVTAESLRARRDWKSAISLQRWQFGGGDPFYLKFWIKLAAKATQSGAQKRQTVKVALRLKKVCYKVFLCENCQRQSCKTFIGLNIRAKMIGGGDPFYLKTL